MHSEKDLIRDIKAMGVEEDDLLTVHTSLKAIGEIDSSEKTGAEVVLDALRACVCKGILMIPAHTYKNIREVPEFDIRNTMPCIGTLPCVAVEMANRAYDARDKTCVRSMQVSHSVVAFGNKAYEFVECDRHVNTRTPMAGCYGKLYYDGGKILLLGVDLSRNTYIHAIDEHIDATVYGSTVVKVTDYNGEVTMREELLTKGPAAATFVRYKQALEAADAVRYGKIGDAESMLIDARICFDVVMETRKNEK